MIVNLWVTALIVAAVVLVVVTTLLHMIFTASRHIHSSVGEIWTGGKRIAGNTVNIGQLERTNFLAGALLEAAASIASAAERIGKATRK